MFKSTINKLFPRYLHCILNQEILCSLHRWLAVIFYLAFLVLTVIIMLNVLIAQMSDTYATVRENARALATYHRARFMLRYLGHYEYWHSKQCGKQKTEVSVTVSWAPVRRYTHILRKCDQQFHSLYDC